MDDYQYYLIPSRPPDFAAVIYSVFVVGSQPPQVIRGTLPLPSSSTGLQGLIRPPAAVHRWAWKVINLCSLTPETSEVEVSARAYQAFDEARVDALAALEVWRGFIPNAPKKLDWS
ncbi:hypothetical protein LH462_06470 [Laribacter hongkongensis]|uniref:Uncharacterized protein n=2 Tax=Laribacter hongkongensis TaxID=168471 RepID=A0A248LJ37_9NEIS|nr:hypothetical protein [Laribacter hongkongensis]ASJ24662.1 hypothetical protein LHGZ1_1831 [Laribacter hongkongensis]MCG9025299.1 hypothetical protein [Laribacter hongkongensis]MCG9042309.1 hypothetical protein [Laribacter hongkongensis]MCG9066156.1 hypothetical protein [Laribacter hongkongensis]MCG9069236.1 hypothetical protein [Laribacter hongkongensis]